MSASCALPLRGRHAVITGGAKGIGLAIARRLAADGAAIALIGRDVPIRAKAARVIWKAPG